MLSFYNVLKRIKASGWIVILLLSIMVYIGIIHFTGEKASTTSKFVVDIETEMEESKEFTSFISIQTFDNEEINQLI